MPGELYNAGNVRLVRDLSGIGMMDAKRAILLAGTEEFRGDVLLAVAYVGASGCAVMVHGDRHKWNMARARSTVEGLRERLPELVAAFPQPECASRP